MAWDAEFAELWEGKKLIASWDKQPMSLAEDSESGDVTAELIDVGAGAADSDYVGKNVRGKLILASSQADGVAAIGVEKYGAAGIVSYAQNQHTGWWGENTELVRWGHLDTFAPVKTFAFMCHLPRSSREPDAVFAVDVLDESRAVKASGCAASP